MEMILVLLNLLYLILLALLDNKNYFYIIYKNCYVRNIHDSCSQFGDIGFAVRS
jgi:hypothetical protein